MARAFLTVFAPTKTSHTVFSLILFAAACLAEEPLDGANHLEAKLATLNPANPDLLADVELFHKGVVWALRYDTPLTPGDDALVRKALASGLGRAEALAANKTDWTTKKGKALRGFVSAVDGSTQPYGVIVRESYNSTRPIRLDVVLHGRCVASVNTPQRGLTPRRDIFASLRGRSSTTVATGWKCSR